MTVVRAELHIIGSGPRAHEFEASFVPERQS